MTDAIEVQTEYRNSNGSCVITTHLFRQYKNALKYVDDCFTQYKKEPDYLKIQLCTTDIWDVEFKYDTIQFRISHKTFVDND